jgi:hypothetical protein
MGSSGVAAKEAPASPAAVAERNSRRDEEFLDMFSLPFERRHVGIVEQSQKLRNHLRKSRETNCPLLRHTPNGR